MNLGIINFLIAQNESPLDTLIRKKWVARTEIGYNFFIGNGSENIKTTPRDLGSIKFNWVIGRRLYYKSIYIAPQFGLAIQEFRFEKNLIPNGQSYLPDTNSQNNYGKSKLQLINFRIPIEVGFQTRKVNIAVGAYGDLLLFSKHKRKYTTQIPNINGFNSSKIEQEIVSNITKREDLNLNTFNVGVYGRIAYKKWGIYASYNINKTLNIAYTDIHAFQAGISFSSTIYKMRRFKILDKLKGIKKI